MNTDTFGDGGNGPGPLSNVRVPLPNLDAYVKDKNAAIGLGKALFWDVQTGSTGNQGCASCHYNAGVDNRSNDNTVHPGPGGVINTIFPLDSADFPFNTLFRNDIVGSQGVPAHNFLGLLYGSPVDVCDGTGGTLQTTGRNAPNIIMAIYNRDSFWDGRAKREFNGVDPFGQFSDPSQSAPSNAKIWVNTSTGLVRQAIVISPASAASQAVGPPNNSVEMACAGRQWHHLGRKMINNGLIPLGQQVVAADDGLLGSPLSNYPAKGLNTTYKDMIRAAFKDHLTTDLLLPDGSGYTQIEENFSLFWGLSIMLWEGIQIPDNSRFDRWAKGQGALTSQELQGLSLFKGKGRCDQCHAGSEFSSSAIGSFSGRAFVNAANRPTAEDTGQQPDAKGKFKAPTIRNTELTGPFFHNGGYLTLRQVVDFYDRGGNFRDENTDSQIRSLGLTNSEKTAIVAFMLSLTDERVRCERAPFDHPSIDIPNGPSITAVGKLGRAAGQCQKPFLNANQFLP